MIAIRGAVRVPENGRDAIHRHTIRLLEEIARRNELEPAAIVSAFFTMTPDLDADFPAHAARRVGWDRVPMLGAQETAVPGAPDRMVRVLIHASVPGPARHVYLGEAAALRPDLAATERTGEPGREGPIGIVGLGLIGGSLGFDLRASGAFRPVRGWDRDPGTRERALQEGAIDGPLAEDDLRAPMTLVLCLPIPGILEWLERRGPTLPAGTVVLDAGSTKSRIVEAMARLPEGVEAVGLHPMAGTERAGFGAARPGLFREAAWAMVETPRTGKAARRRTRALLRAVGGREVTISPERHDRSVARTSHLPWMVSAALARTVASGDPKAGKLAGPGLRGAVRLAASDPALVAGILSTNWPEVREAALAYRAELDRLIAELDGACRDGGDDAALVEIVRGVRAGGQSLLRMPSTPR